ncbi:MAG TPA: hypothetical protein VMQ81_07475 [Acidimicrobiia bacterium]|nr:hypothetical protein [Acidimicrobiia bacterium]
MIVGTLGSPARARVDGRGRITADGAGWELDWWIGAEDRRHLPATEAAVRQKRLAPAPAAETAMRVPGGDAIQRVYAVGGPGDLVVMEVENASAVPFAVGFVVRSGPQVVLPRQPLRREPADGGGEALVFPVAHRTVRRIAVALSDAPDDVDVNALPDAESVARGWEAQLERGMRVDLPDAALQRAVDAARADVLLEGRDMVALEDWGFDDEATEAWQRLGFRERRRAARRPRGHAVIPFAGLDTGPQLLAAVRSHVVRDMGEAVDLLVRLPATWRAGNIDVRDAPTRRGRVSYAVRWHGDRPALLWECERPGVRLRAPGLDPAWSTTEQQGDALLMSVTNAVM